MPASTALVRELIRENVPLAPLTSFGIGGPARFFAEATDEAEMLEALRFARTEHLPLFILGGGSNLLLDDAGFAGLVLRIAIAGPCTSTSRNGSVLFDVPAGTDWDSFVRLTCSRGLSGVECLAGIPGLTGGTPVQNVGAYGQEVAQTILAVRAYDLHTSAFVSLSNADCHFSYRGSLFNGPARGRYLVTAVTFQLSTLATPNLSYADLARHFAGQHPSPSEVADVVREIRRGKGMLLTPGDPDARSAGSFFKNPVVPESLLHPISDAAHLPPDQVPHWPAGPGLIKLPAAWLLERAGFTRGLTRGQAGISSRHTLALINRGSARFTDIARLRDEILAEVERRFSVTLEQEPVMLPADTPR